MAIHLWPTGAIRLFTLAVMTRASRGHTGRPLVAGMATTALYLLVVIAAFLGFAILHVGMLTQRRR